MKNQPFHNPRVEAYKQKFPVQAAHLSKEFKEFEEHIAAGGYVPSGGWCNMCNKYACGDHT